MLLIKTQLTIALRAIRRRAPKTLELYTHDSTSGIAGRIESENTMNPETRKIIIKITNAAIPIPLCINSADFPTKPSMKSIKKMLMTKTANQGVIVNTYFLTPAPEMKIVATRNERNNRSQGFASSPKSLVFAKTAYIIINTIRKARIGAK